MTKTKWCSGWQHAWYKLGPGFDPQVPQRLIKFFSNVILCRQREATHHRPHIPACQVSIRSRSKGQEREHTILLVNSAPLNSQSQQALCKMGLIIPYTPSNLAQTPLGFAIFIFYILFVLFLFFPFINN